MLSKVTVALTLAMVAVAASGTVASKGVTMKRLFLILALTALSCGVAAGGWARSSSRIVGTAKNDVLKGTIRSDVIEGRAGNDRLAQAVWGRDWGDDWEQHGHTETDLASSDPRLVVDILTSVDELVKQLQPPGEPGGQA